MAMAAGKKSRKPYRITRPREKWTADEHGRFLHALQLFGHDWKQVSQFVATKTATQIRSHAQKPFLKAQKLACLTKPHVHHEYAAATLHGSGVRLQQSVDWPGHDWFMEAPKCTQEQAERQSEACWFADALLPDQEEHLPLSPDDRHFAQVYRFIGHVFGSDAPMLDEAQLQRLQGMDPVVVETILIALSNLQVNLPYLFRTLELN